MVPVSSNLLFFCSRNQLLGEGYGEEKLPMTVVVPSVPDNSPRPAPSSAAAAAPGPAPTPTAAPTPATVPGSEDYMPTLPSERRNPGAPSGGNAGAPAPADGASSTAFISSNPAVPLPAGVNDSATVLPMPTPGQEKRQVNNHESQTRTSQITDFFTFPLFAQQHFTSVRID
jgi:hypothetical protein